MIPQDHKIRLLIGILMRRTTQFYLIYHAMDGEGQVNRSVAATLQEGMDLAARVTPVARVEPGVKFDVRLESGSMQLNEALDRVPVEFTHTWKGGESSAVGGQQPEIPTHERLYRLLGVDPI